MIQLKMKVGDPFHQKTAVIWLETIESQKEMSASLKFFPFICLIRQ
jgi:hypothetical protein